MKKEQQPFSELYSPEMKLRISEAHSMIMEQAGDLNLSSLIPNWKNMKINDLIPKIIIISSKLNESNASPDWLKKYWSPSWRSSKFGKMTMEEVAEYAYSTPEHRKEVRNFVEKEYEWLLKNAPEGIVKSVRVRGVEKDLKKGKDPHDFFYTSAERGRSVVPYLSMLVIFLQLLLWLVF